VVARAGDAVSTVAIPITVVTAPIARSTRIRTRAPYRRRDGWRSRSGRSPDQASDDR
jgi:hypothetical protein